MSCCRRKNKAIKRIKNPPSNQGSVVADKAKPHNSKMRFSGRGSK